MLRRENRLRRSREFSQVRNRGRSWSEPLMILHVCRRQDVALRVGFTVSKKVGKAVVRNRVKRLMREGLRGTLVQVKPGHDLIFTARPASASASFGEVRLAIEGLLRKCALLQEN